MVYYLSLTKALQKQFVMMDLVIKMLRLHAMNFITLEKFNIIHKEIHVTLIISGLMM